MRTFLRIILKPLSFLPAIFMMYLIFTFSAQDGVTSAQLSYKVSYKIVEIGGELLGADFEPWEIENLANRFHGPIRKVAHMTEYFALAVSVAFPLYVYGLRGFPLMLVAGLFCVAFACGDEYHQASVSGRSPSKKDVLIDSFGVFWGIVLVRIVGWTGRKTIFRPLSKKKKSKAKKGAPEATAYSQPDQGGYYSPNGQTPYYGNNGYPNQPNSYAGNNGYPNQTNPYAGNGGYPNQPNPYFGNSGYSNQPNPYYGNNSYPNQANPYYGNVPAQERRSASVSDNLSEDMSFKKLMHDIKDQKKEARSDRKFAKKPAVDGDDIPVTEINLDD